MYFFYHILCVESQNVYLQQLLLVDVATNVLGHVSILCIELHHIQNFPSQNPIQISFFLGSSFHITSKHRCSTRSGHFHYGLYLVLIGASYFQFHYLGFDSRYETCFHEFVNSLKYLFNFSYL
jgi:hypothetical protein